MLMRYDQFFNLNKQQGNVFIDLLMVYYLKTFY